MNKQRIIALLFIGVLILAAFMAVAFRRIQTTEVPPLLLAPTYTSTEGFARAEGPVVLSFPQDMGPHPEYLTEWWYYTGNVETTEGRHFGYQLTFFRRALLPVSEQPKRESDWAMNQLYMAHFAITDTSAEQIQAFERFERGSAGLAGASAEPYQIWVNDWQVQQTGSPTYRLVAQEDGFAIDLQLVDVKGPILQGEQGYSPKGPEPGNASYYISQTRLSTQGTVSVGDETFSVKGYSWMDHEYSTSALGPGLVGWDWFSLQLSNGEELMLFILRREDGRLDPFSSGTMILADGSTRQLSSTDFKITPVVTWKSPSSGAEYPSGWRVTVPGEKLELTVMPRIPNQELRVSFTYWEGAVKIQGQQNGTPVTGQGYVELTGYAASMQGQF